MPDLSEDEELLKELGLEPERKTIPARTPREERVIAGFEDIQRFVDTHDRVPVHDTDGDIFERLYAVRLGRLRTLTECRTLLEPLDRQGLLGGAPETVPDAEMDDAALLTALGADSPSSDLTTLRHVRSTIEKKAVEEVAQRDPCPDFDRFKPLFNAVQADLNSGNRKTHRFGGEKGIKPGRFFILSGQKAYVAESEDTFRNDYGDHDARLRVVFDNGTQSRMLMRSLQRALQKDNAGRRITEPESDAGPLFATAAEDGDEETGTIYVLSSLADHPWVAERRDLFHKIGVTSMPVERRIANAAKDPTYLMAGVTVERTYKLLNITRSRFESLLHRVLEPARADVEITDRFGNPMRPREWFLVPLFVIDQVVDAIVDGTIQSYRYDPTQARLV